MASTRSPDQKVRLTKTAVDRMLAPATGQIFLRDAELKGFAVRMTAGGVKAFVVEKRVDGRVRRIKLGRYPEVTVEQARKRAQEMLEGIAGGGNPVADKQRAEFKGITLGKAFEDFLRARRNLKPKTVYDYRRLMAVAFEDWEARRLVDIRKDAVLQRHQQLGDQRGEAYANLAMRFLRSVINFAIAHYEDETGRALLPENPVARITQTPSWYRSTRRQTGIRRDELARWYEAVTALGAEGAHKAMVISDYLVFLLFTGLRRQEAAQLRWSDVDLDRRTLVIPDPKNRIPLVLPLSGVAAQVLERRAAARVNGYVFAGSGAAGFLVEPRKHMVKVSIRSGIPFTLHDLRRTFITVAESLDISAYALKRLVNHRVSSDVTDGYIVSDVERLRGPMDRIGRALEDAVRTGASPGPFHGSPPADAAADDGSARRSHNGVD